MTTLYTLLVGFGVPIVVVCAVLAGAYWLAVGAIRRTDYPDYMGEPGHSDYDGDR